MGDELLARKSVRELGIVFAFSPLSQAQLGEEK